MLNILCSISAPFAMLSGINCTSNVTDMVTVIVQCDFNTSMYSGYRVYIQDTSIPVTLRFTESTVSGETVSINSSAVSGEHLVFVYPIWSSDIPDGRLAPALSATCNLVASITTIAPTLEGMTSYLVSLNKRHVTVILLIITASLPLDILTTSSPYTPTMSFQTTLSSLPPVSVSVRPNTAAIIGNIKHICTQILKQINIFCQ